MPLSDKRPYVEWHLEGTDFLPPNWVEQVEACIDEHAKTSVLDADVTTGFQESSRIRVVFGDDCKHYLPWLYDLYVGRLLQFISESMSRTYYTARDLRSAININVLEGKGAFYEEHCDSNPLTGLLFVTDADATSGGQLVFKYADGSQHRVNPRRGLFIAFDARQLVHYVSPLESDFRRISVPMNFYDSPETQLRPEGLDQRLYEDSIVRES